MSYKILLVDQDASATARIGGALSAAGHRILAAGDAAQAVDLLGRDRPDVTVVVDGASGMPAAALCMKIKKTPHGRVTPLVFLTARVPRSAEDLARRRELFGCDRILDHAATGEQLLQVVAQLVPGAPAGSSPHGDATVPGLTAVPRSASAQVNRDVPSAAAFLDADLHAALDPARAEDAGQDIAEHLDSIFTLGLPTSAEVAAPTGSPRTSEAASRSAARAGDERPAPRAVPPPPRPEPAPPPPPARTAPAPIANRPQPRTRPAPSRVAPGPVPARGAAAAETSAATPRVPARAPAPSTPRQAPRAVEQLQLPRIQARPADVAAAAAPARKRGLAAAVGVVALIGSATVVYFALRGEAVPDPPVQVAQVEPSTVPAAAATDRREPLPAPSPLDAPTASDADVESPRTAPDPAPPPAREDAVTQPPPSPVKTEATPGPVERPAPTTRPVAASRPAEPVSAPTRPASDAREPAAGTTATAAAETPRPAAEAAAPVDRTETPPAETAPPEQAGPTAAESAPVAATTAGAGAGRPTDGSPAEPDARVEKAPARPADPAAAARPAVVPPEVVERVEPKYSAKAVKGVADPTVSLRVLVDERGRIARVLVDQGIPGSELEAAAISAVLRWSFRPATEAGVPVKAWTTVRFVFEP